MAAPQGTQLWWAWGLEGVKAWRQGLAGPEERVSLSHRSRSQSKDGQGSPLPPGTGACEGRRQAQCPAGVLVQRVLTRDRPSALLLGPSQSREQLDRLLRDPHELLCPGGQLQVLGMPARLGSGLPTRPQAELAPARPGLPAAGKLGCGLSPKPLGSCTRGGGLE